MNWKNKPKENAYVKFILPHSLLPYKSARRNNQAAVTGSAADGTPGLMGVSRGGKTTKIHALVTENFQLIGLKLTGGQVHDSECARELLSKVNLDGKNVLGDKAFCSARIRDFIQAVCIPDKTNSRVLHDFDRELCKARNVVERFFLRIKNRRHIATRFDKLALSFLNFVLLAAIMLQV